MAGSSLLRDPHAMFDLVSEMVKAVGGVVPMTVKMRRCGTRWWRPLHVLLACRCLPLAHKHAALGTDHDGQPAICLPACAA